MFVLIGFSVARYNYSKTRSPLNVKWPCPLTNISNKQWQFREWGKKMAYMTIIWNRTRTVIIRHEISCNPNYLKDWIWCYFYLFNHYKADVIWNMPHSSRSYLLSKWDLKFPKENNEKRYIIPFLNKTSYNIRK